MTTPITLEQHKLDVLALRKHSGQLDTVERVEQYITQQAERLRDLEKALRDIAGLTATDGDANDALIIICQIAAQELHAAELKKQAALAAQREG